MKTVFQHIHHIHGKPHHIRKQIAFSIAGAAAALIAFVWLVSSISTGVFAIKGTSFADSQGQGSAVVTSSDAGSQNLAGVGAALPSAAAPSHIEIVDTSSSAGKKSEQTTLPF